MSEHLVAKGAVLTVHTAAALGLTALVHALLDEDPALLKAPGGDGARPLHFAHTVNVAEVLIERGAKPDAREEEHRSTPAQWHIKASPDVTRLLLQQGAEPDVFLVAGLDDLDLTQGASSRYRQRHLPDRQQLSPFPGIGFEGSGGTILQWQLGFKLSPQEVAIERAYRDVYALLMQTPPPRSKLQIACMLDNRKLAMSLVASHPKAVDDFDDEELTLLARACWETNNDTEAIRLMLDC